MTPGVYQFRNIVNSKRYIGSSARCIFGRRMEHVKSLNKGDHGNLHLQNAWKVYGPRNFIFETLEIFEILHLSKRERAGYAESREQFYILEVDQLLLYNICRKVAGSRFGTHMPKKSRIAIGDKLRGRVMSEETKEKLRIANVGQGLGRKLSQSTREKMSSSRTGHKLSDSHCEALSNGRKGIVFSEEHRKNLTKAQIRRFKNPEQRELASIVAKSLPRRSGRFVKDGE